MKLKLLLLLSVMCLSYPSVGQHIRTDKYRAVAQSSCLADSVKRTLDYLQRKADVITMFQYYYDNGSPESATVFWQVTGKTFAKSFQGCRPSSRLITHLSADTLFSFYRQQRIAELPEMAVPDNAPSHSMAYFIGVYLPGKTRFYNIKDSQRHLLIYPNLSGLLPGETPVEAKEDPRSIWIDLFEKVTK